MKVRPYPHVSYAKQGHGGAPQNGASFMIRYDVNKQGTYHTDFVWLDPTRYWYRCKGQKFIHSWLRNEL